MNRIASAVRSVALVLAIFVLVSPAAAQTPKPGPHTGKPLLFAQPPRTEQERGVDQITCPPPARPTCGANR